MHIPLTYVAWTDSGIALLEFGEGVAHTLYDGVVNIAHGRIQRLKKLNYVCFAPLEVFLDQLMKTKTTLRGA